MSEPTALLWCDLETSGLDKHECLVLEVACFVTDPTGENRRDDFEMRINYSSESNWKSKLDDVVFEMHTNSGLFDAIDADGVSWMYFLNCFNQYMNEQVRFNDGKPLTMAGSGVGPFDLPVLLWRIPGLDKMLTYYVMDVGVIGRFLRNVCGIELPKRPVVGHRAMDDINDHHAELMEYKEILKRIK